MAWYMCVTATVYNFCRKMANRDDHVLASSFRDEPELCPEGCGRDGSTGSYVP